MNELWPTRTNSLKLKRKDSQALIREARILGEQADKLMEQGNNLRKESEALRRAVRRREVKRKAEDGK